MKAVAIRAHPLVFGVVVFLASESMLFAGLLAAWYDLRGLAPQWMPSGTEIDLGLATFGTLLLGAGSVTMGVAQAAAARRKRRIARAMLVLTLFCALGFVCTALRDWSLANFQISSSAYGTLFFVVTGTHLAHVIAGAVLLIALISFLGRPAFTRDHTAGVEAIAYYWHFVFVVWLAVYATIYLVR
jgi:cytochrome c oxidase subunit 3